MSDMTAVAISSMQLRKSIGDILNRVQYTGERFIVERKGDAVAAIVPVELLEQLERLEAEQEIELLRLAKLAAAAEGTVPFTTLVEQYQALHGEPLHLPHDA